jgi:hypothetical protein
VWNELALQEKKISLMNTIRMLDEAEVTPNLISKELVSDMASKIAVPQNKKELAFYQEKKACSYLELDSDPNGRICLEGDPCLSYHEFCILLGRIALEVSKDFEDKKKSKRRSDEDDASEILRFFMKEILGFEMMNKMKKDTGSKLNLAAYTKKSVFRLIEFEKELGNDYLPYQKAKEEVQTTTQKDLEHMQMVETLDFEPDMNTVAEVLNGLQKILPELPSPPNPNRENLPPYTNQVVVVGEQIPEEKGNKAKPRAAPARINNKEKPIKYAGTINNLQSHAWKR